jgi:C4-dicarboxylate-specific signal transduction histidine kinase
LVLQLEPVVAQLRSRLDALFDDAKAPLLRARADFVVLDLRPVIRAALPALKQTMVSQRTNLGLDLAFVDPTPDQPFLIRGREGEIQRILENLIANAAAAQSSAVAISLVLKEYDQVGLIIEDDGPGFPAWFLERDPAGLGSTRQGGTGFGLLGVSANVRGLNGRITFDNGSALGGARIQIVFPHAETLVQRAAADAAAVPASAAADAG